VVHIERGVGVHQPLDCLQLGTSIEVDHSGCVVYTRGLALNAVKRETEWGCSMTTSYLSIRILLTAEVQSAAPKCT